MKRFISHIQGLCTHQWRIVLVLLVAMSPIISTLDVPDISLALTTKPKPKQQEQRPCDIYAAAHTPCVAAHSTVRALFASYNGKLYQIQRKSDSKTLDLKTLTRGGYVNAAPQIPFCSGTTCTITIIYDQTSSHNDLPISWGGFWHGPGPNGYDYGADAMALPITIAGHKAFGVKITNDVGYRAKHAKGVATGSHPEGTYMVTSSDFMNGRCCFDYGNGEASGKDDGNATMDALYFGSLCIFGSHAPCVGTGPWVEADLENGVFHNNKGSNTDPNNPGVHYPFVSAWLKNNGVTNFTLKSGNAQSGGLTTAWSGPLPDSYSPMKLEGSIILGTGGDNSTGDVGEFFEGAMTSGYPTNKTENAVQTNIVSAGYGSSSSHSSKSKPKSQVNAVALPSRRHQP